MFVRLLVVCCSLGILGGYVWYRQDQAAKSAASNAPLNIEHKSDDTEDADPPPPEDIETIIMSSSKSGRVIMPGSKSAPMEFDILPINPETQFPVEPSEPEEENDEETQEPPRVLLPSSKSIDRLLVPRQNDDNE